MLSYFMRHPAQCAKGNVRWFREFDRNGRPRPRPAGHEIPENTRHNCQKGHFTIDQPARWCSVRRRLPAVTAAPARRKELLCRRAGPVRVRVGGRERLDFLLVDTPFDKFAPGALKPFVDRVRCIGRDHYLSPRTGKCRPTNCSPVNSRRAGNGLRCSHHWRLGGLALGEIPVPDEQ